MRYTTEIFIEKAKKIHGDKYDYSLVDYKGCNIPVKIICNTCGEVFEQKPRKHLLGHGCTEHMKNKKLTFETFLEKAKKAHGDDFDYTFSNIDFNGNKNEVRIIHKKCGKMFFQYPSLHIFGHGCIFCANNIKKTTEQFIEEAKKIHGDKYDYSLVDYKGGKKNVKIICNTCHNIFEQQASHHLKGCGCAVCANVRTLSTEHFIEKAKKVHGDKYDYSLVDYKNNHTKVKIICPKGHTFEQKPNGHLLGYGCPFCKESKGEARISDFLNKNKILFEREYIYDDLKFINSLRYDFYLEKYNLLIEYQGEQHYIPATFGSNATEEEAKEELKIRRHRDWLKRRYAKDNKINFLAIPYWDYNKIEEIVGKTISDLQQEAA